MQLLPCQQEDLLSQDPPVRGQNYACVSFVSPERTLLRKDVFRVSHFLEAVARDVKGVLDGVAACFPSEEETIDLIRERHAYLWSPPELQRQFEHHCAHSDADHEFDTQNGFQTSVRGLKIRGVYESLEEARLAAQRFRALDNNMHDVYVSQVGCWCPWQPDPEAVQESEYLETQLNTLMKCYRENAEAKDEVFEARRREKAAAAVAAGSSSSVSVGVGDDST
jgi:hypothetical protein